MLVQQHFYSSCIRLRNAICLITSCALLRAHGPLWRPGMRISTAYIPGKNDVFNLHLLDEVDAFLRNYSSRADFLCGISKKKIFQFLLLSHRQLTLSLTGRRLHVCSHSPIDLK